MWETYRLFPGCHNGSGQSVLIQLHYFCTPQKGNIGIYSRCFSTIRKQLVMVFLMDPLLWPRYEAMTAESWPRKQ